MFDLILVALFLFIPAYLGNMMPVFWCKIKMLDFLKVPLDGGRYIGKYRILGDHKTFLGLIAGSCGGGIGGLLQYFLYKNFQNIFIYEFVFFNSLILAIIYGFLAGFGAMFGDSLKSFFKRRVNISDGKTFPPFDQIDFIVGAYVFTSLFFKVPLNIFLIAVVITIPLHLLANIIAYGCGYKKVWW